MTAIAFDVTLFRSLFPQFSNSTTYPDVVLDQYFASAICYLSDDDYGYLGYALRLQALNLMTAHLAYLSTQINNNAKLVPGLAQSATIDKITVSLTPPPLKNQWQWWLSLSPYGQQLFALLQVNSVGGFYVGGSPEHLAFRGIC